MAGLLKHLLVHDRTCIGSNRLNRRGVLRGGVCIRYNVVGGDGHDRIGQGKRLRRLAGRGRLHPRIKKPPFSNPKLYGRCIRAWMSARHTCSHLTPNTNHTINKRKHTSYTQSLLTMHDPLSIHNGKNDRTPNTHEPRSKCKT